MNTHWRELQTGFASVSAEVIDYARHERASIR